MGSAICHTKKQKKLDLEKEIRKIQLQIALQSPDIINKSNNESLVEGNSDGYFSELEYQYYQKQSSPLEFGKESVRENQNEQLNWTQTNQVLGQGSFGTIYLCINSDNGLLMANKQVIIKGYNLASNDYRIKSFEWEIELLKKLKHPNIVKYFGMSRGDDKINLFMEYVAGGSIAQLLNRYGKFKEGLIQLYMRQVLLGLEYLHSHGVIHRDIKGANILVDSNGICKLADFGSSRKLSELLQKEDFKTLIGTVNWMAPEVIMQTGHGRFADIWSIGCTIIEMATGKPPWSELSTSSQMVLMLQIANRKDTPKVPEGLSPQAQDFISKCFQINPKQRWNIKHLLSHPWIQTKQKQNLKNSVLSNQSDDFQKILNQSKYKQKNDSMVQSQQKSMLSIQKTPIQERSQLSPFREIDQFQEVIPEQGSLQSEIGDQKQSYTFNLEQNQKQQQKVLFDKEDRLVSIDCHSQLNNPLEGNIQDKERLGVTNHFQDIYNEEQNVDVEGVDIDIDIDKSAPIEPINEKLLEENSQSSRRVSPIQPQSCQPSPFPSKDKSDSSSGKNTFSGNQIFGTVHLPISTNTLLRQKESNLDQQNNTYQGVQKHKLLNEHPNAQEVNEEYEYKSTSH